MAENRGIRFVCLAMVVAAAFAPTWASSQDDTQSEGVSDRIAAQCGRQADISTEEVMELPLAERQSYVACGLKELALALSEQLPRDVGNGDRVIAASATDTTFVMTIEVSNNERDRSAISDRVERWRNQLCRDDDGQALIEVGGAYQFVWIDGAGTELGETTVDHC